MIRIEPEDVKARVSLRDLLDRSGIEVKRSGANWVCCCPFHREKSASFVVHEQAGGDWYRCFGCGAGGDAIKFWQEFHHVDFKTAMDVLGRIAGFGGDAPAPLPKRVVPAAPEDAPVDPMGPEDWRKWERAMAQLYTDMDEMKRIAAWRGIRVEVIDWAARRGLMGRMINRGDWREAFLIQRPVEREGGVWALEAIGWHVRLAPHSRANDGDKASWRYEPRNGLGAWPFVIVPEGGAGEVKYWFFCEGQWDGLALVDLMGWEARWPRQVGLMGMRGASSWKRAMDYPLQLDAVAFLIADRDEAGEGWFVRTETARVSFAEGLEKLVWAVYGFWPSLATGKKDLNDVVRDLDEGGRMIARTEFLKKILPPKRKPAVGPTFFLWLKRQSRRKDEVGEFAAWAHGRAVPRGRAREAKWLGFQERQQAPEGIVAAFTAARMEWDKLTAELAARR